MWCIVPKMKFSKFAHFDSKVPSKTVKKIPGNLLQNLGEMQFSHSGKVRTMFGEKKDELSLTRHLYSIQLHLRRKRNHKDESVVQSPEPAQESKRRLVKSVLCL